MRTRSGLTAMGAIVAVGMLWSAPAHGDGLPVPGVTVKPGGVTTPGSPDHYTTTRAGNGTLVRHMRGNSIIDSTRLPGNYTVPGVAIDGSPGGLSADGATLALIRPRQQFPQSHTHLAILQTGPDLALQRRVNLPGDFSFDAISPDGSRLYLIQYLSRRDPTQYAVRAFDTASARLIAGTITDPHESNPDEMRGYPINRVMSPDGRWAYTLYSGSPKPFVHALDTASGTAHCIDLPKLGGSVYGDHLDMSPAGGSFRVVRGRGHTEAVVDTATLEATAPTPADPAGSGPSEPDTTSDNSGSTWWLLAAGLGLLAAIGAVFIRHRRRAALAG